MGEEKLSQPWYSQEKNTVSIADGGMRCKWSFIACNVEGKKGAKLDRNSNYQRLLPVGYIFWKRQELKNNNNNFQILNFCVYSVSKTNVPMEPLKLRFSLRFSLPLHTHQLSTWQKKVTALLWLIASQDINLPQQQRNNFTTALIKWS